MWTGVRGVDRSPKKGAESEEWTDGPMNRTITEARTYVRSSEYYPKILDWRTRRFRSVTKVSDTGLKVIRVADTFGTRRRLGQWTDNRFLVFPNDVPGSRRAPDDDELGG